MIEKLLELIEQDEKEEWFKGYNYESSADYLFEILDEREEFAEQTNNRLKELCDHMEKLPASIMVGVLTASNSCNNKIEKLMPYREAFRNKAREVLRTRGESEERIKHLLEGFENK